MPWPWRCHGAIRLLARIYVKSLECCDACYMQYGQALFAAGDGPNSHASARISPSHGSALPSIASGRPEATLFAAALSSGRASGQPAACHHCCATSAIGCTGPAQQPTPPIWLCHAATCVSTWANSGCWEIASSHSCHMSTLVIGSSGSDQQ